jgi:hypothetical protein
MTLVVRALIQCAGATAKKFSSVSRSRSRQVTAPAWRCSQSPKLHKRIYATPERVKFALAKTSGRCGERERPSSAGVDGGNRLVERGLAGVAAFRQCWKGHERTRPCAWGSRMGTPQRVRGPAGKLYDCVLIAVFAALPALVQLYVAQLDAGNGARLQCLPERTSKQVRERKLFEPMMNL